MRSKVFTKTKKQIPKNFYKKQKIYDKIIRYDVNK